MKAVLFDMDGTLVPMDIDVFTKKYFSAITAALAPYGYEPAELEKGIMRGLAAMVENDGTRNNYDVFWDSLKSVYGDRIIDDIPLFDRYYNTDFDDLRSSVGYNSESARVISRLNARGVKLVLATNPVFPAVAVEKRVSWADIDPRVFAYITTYKNSHYCKPNPAYYTEIASVIGCDPADCLMIGNDVREDGAARAAGMDVFILTDCLIDRKGELERFPHGGFAELNVYLTERGL